MILKILITFLLVDCVFAYLLWLLLNGDLSAAEHQIVQAEQQRDRAIDEWFRTPEPIIVDLSGAHDDCDKVAEPAPRCTSDRPMGQGAHSYADEPLL